MGSKLVYKPKGSKTYVYDFERGGRRFSGSTTATTEAKARAAVQPILAEAEEWARQSRAAKAVGKGLAPMTIGQACDRYWAEVAIGQAMASQLHTHLNRARDYFGANRRLDSITDNDIALWVASRRGETRWGRKKTKAGAAEQLVAPRTVNMTTIKLLQPIFRRAKEVWKQALPFEPKWTTHLLPTRKGAVMRVLKLSDEDRIAEELPEGFRDVFRFALAAGLRLAECLLRWDQIDWDSRTITVTQKGGRPHTIPISNAIAAILSACPKADDEWVFTYVCERTCRENKTKILRLRGTRYPVTYQGLKTKWRRVVQDKKGLGLAVRFHDMRHTRASRLIQKTGNLKATQKLLGHATIAITAQTYAHLDMNDVRDTLDAADAQPRKSQKKSQNQVEMDLKPMSVKEK